MDRETVGKVFPLPMPLNLVLVRHGESEGNIIQKQAKKGDSRLQSSDYLKTHSSKWRLTARGVRQAQSAGVWIRGHLLREHLLHQDPFSFGRHYVSTYVRAYETAARLGLPNAQWLKDHRLHERDWGLMDAATAEENSTRFKEVLTRQSRDGFGWTPLNGESKDSMILRIRDFLDTLHRECGDMNVIIVSHGEIMWTFRFALERMTPEQFEGLEGSDDPLDHIHNGQVIQYSRVDPRTGEIAPVYEWMRSICPWDISKSPNEWGRISRPRFTNEDLQREADQYRRFL